MSENLFSKPQTPSEKGNRVLIFRVCSAVTLNKAWAKAKAEQGRCK